MGVLQGISTCRDGTTWLSTDNDRVDDHSGKTLFWILEHRVVLMLLVADADALCIA